MNKILNCLANKVMYIALVALGSFAASAELVKTPILQTFEDENGTVTESVGYKVTGLENGEVAMVYTNHLRTATLRVRADLENVQFLVVGGGGGGGAGLAGPGGGGGGVVTGFVYKLEKNVAVDVKVGAGGKGGQSYLAGGKAGGDSSIVVGKTPYVLAYGGGAGARYANGGDGGSGSGGGADKNSTIEYIGGKVKEAVCAEGVLFAESFGHEGGSNGTSQYSSGGGGGAMGVGGDAVVKTGGNGGDGLKMDITGSLITYGSGGGGGSAGTNGIGGTNAGNGGKNSGSTNKKAGSAKANCGGGGGGGGPSNFYAPDYIGYGGNGGSGIVVLRYKEPNTSGFKVIVR